VSKAPAFQLYAADFYMDTVGWSCEEIGLYFRLLMAEWVNGPLPDDPVRLSKTCQISLKKFQVNFILLAPKFVKKEGGFLINERLEKTRQEQMQFSELQREKGAKSAKKRWGKKVTKVTPRLQPDDKPKDNSSSSPSIREVGKSIKFIIPTVEQVSAYCLERNNGINPQVWMDHYTSNGWKVGKNKMVDWQAAVRTWENGRGGNGNGGNGHRSGESKAPGTAGLAKSDDRAYPTEQY